MKRRFLALRIISMIYKILAVFAFIAMIGAIVVVLIDANNFPTIESKLPVIGAAFGSGIVGTLVLLAVSQLIDLLIALEMNTRSTTAMLQQLGRIMKERL
ncbi:MAG: hypothetical protein U0521_28970 [Anaerolineae bacterium]